MSLYPSAPSRVYPPTDTYRWNKIVTRTLPKLFMFCMHHLLNPLVKWVTSWKRTTTASDSSRAVCGVAIRDIVAIQHSMFIKLHEETINDFLSLIRKIKIYITTAMIINQWLKRRILKPYSFWSDPLLLNVCLIEANEQLIQPPYWNRLANKVQAAVHAEDHLDSITAHEVQYMQPIALLYMLFAAHIPESALWHSLCYAYTWTWAMTL